MTVFAINRKSVWRRAARAVRSRSTKLAGTAVVLAAITALAWGPATMTGSASLLPPTFNFTPNKRPVPNYDVNLTTFARRLPATAQLQALNALKTNLGDQNVTARWDKGSGSVDTLLDFASAPSSLSPEEAARAFLTANAGLFGISDLGTLRLKRDVDAFGGNLLYFEQTHVGLPVANGGVGVVMDGQRRIKMISGPYYANISINTTPGLDAATAVIAAQTDLDRYRRPWAAGVAAVLNPALDLIQSQLGLLATPHPQLNIFPTPNGARLAYTFFLFSRNPFGMFKYQIDALSGQILYRDDHVRYQQPLPLTADIFPTYPSITQELKDQGIISVGPDGTPLGQLRIGLRNFDATNALTGQNDTLTGLHAHIENALAARLPFAQAARGTWHFRVTDAANLEQRTNEREHFGPNAEPAMHQDAISQFFYINSLLEYIDYLHRAGDAAHNRGFGQGDFPDTYPNQDRPLIGNVHIPNVLNPPQPGDPAFAEKLLGLDNAFSLNASQEIEGQQIVVNPTSYGHGYLLNNLAIDFAVPYHEGMHSISSPIAGLEGVPEGNALNEAQADLWAYSAAENPALGAYVLNGFKLRELVRAGGGDPDLRQYIRHGDSGLSYTQLGTSGAADFEEHRDGEIFAATMWDLRELMLMYETGGSWKRPDLITGAPSVSIPLGKENWERVFLGAIYVLATFNPDTFVRARDAMIIADAALYPSDPTDPDSPGIHRAVIEQVFAAHEIGLNAEAPVGGRQVISTRVSNFTGSQGKLSPPTGVSVALTSPASARVSWQPVAGAFGYEVLKREIGRENERFNKPVFGHEYIDGDGTTDGYLHVAYVTSNQTSYLDNGIIEGAFVPRGLRNPVSGEYVVRSLSVNSNRQVGVSNNSSGASAPTNALKVTTRMQTAISNIVFANGKAEFDQTLKNLGAGAFDGTVYTPIEFQITSISNPTVTVANADSCGAGQGGDPASFFYRQKLHTGETSAPRRLIFNNPNSQLFTFDAVIIARVQTDSASATRYQPEPPVTPACFEPRTSQATFDGIVPGMDTGLQLIPGVTYVDVPFTSAEGAFGVVGAMTSTLGLDLDLELLDSAGRVLSSSLTGSANETLASPIEPHRNYVFRVIGWAGVAQDFSIQSTQHQLVHKASPAGSGGSGPGVVQPAPGGNLISLLRFTLNPLTRTVTIRLLN